MNELTADLATQTQEKYYGKYRGVVEDNRDPEKRGRLRVRVPKLLGKTVTGWVLPCLPFGGLKDQGWFTVPEVNAQVWIEFEEGDLSRPIWTGTFWQQSGDPPAEAAKDQPTTRVLKTPAGHVLQFDDASGEEQFRLHHPKNAEMLIDKDGTVSLTDAKGSSLTLDANAKKIRIADANGNALTLDSSGISLEDKNGNRIEMGANGITVKGKTIVVEGASVQLGGQGGEPIIKGLSFLTLFATHTHTCTAPNAPTSPPIPQGEMSTISQGVTST